MNTLFLSEERQIQAMLEGNICALLKERLKRDIYDIRDYVNVDRQKVIAYLKLHSQETEKYFNKFAQYKGTHDCRIIWQDGKLYKTATMDHGRRIWIRTFRTMEEAVAEYILVLYGMY